MSLEPNSPWQQFVASLYGREGVLSGEHLGPVRKWPIFEIGFGFRV